MTTKPKPPNPLEIDIVRAFRKRLYYGAPAVSMVAVPNASKRTMWAAKQAKREGMATGFPDCMCFAPGGKLAIIEFKRIGGVISDNQAEWLDRLARYGFAATVARSADEAMDFLRGLGFPIMEQAA